jgi:hypothetical protein
VTNETGRSLSPEDARDVLYAEAARLIRDGRSFEGVLEPPLPPDAVWRGMALARRQFARDPFDPGTQYRAEIGLAVDERWAPVSYGKQERPPLPVLEDEEGQGQADADGEEWPRLRLILDLLFTHVEENEDGDQLRYLVHTDYKSAPSTKEAELQTLQLQAQTLLVLAHVDASEYDAIKRRVVNLATGATFTETIWLDGTDDATLDEWRAQLTTTMTALDDTRDARGWHRAAPGGGCHGCPWVLSCEHAGEYLSEAVGRWQTTEDRARAWMVLRAAAAALGAKGGLLRRDTADGPVEVDGYLVGDIVKPGREVIPEAGAALFARWEEHGGEIHGFLENLKPGISQIEAIAKALFPERVDIPERKDLIAELVKPCEVTTFAHKKKEEEKDA